MLLATDSRRNSEYLMGTELPLHTNMSPDDTRPEDEEPGLGNDTLPMVNLLFSKHKTTEDMWCVPSVCVLLSLVNEQNKETALGLIGQN